MRGTMLWFNDMKDLGAIAADDGERLPVRGAAFAEGERPQGRCAGSPVTFQVAVDEEERTAADVSFVAEIVPRRARMRHSRFRSG